MKKLLALMLAMALALSLAACGGSGAGDTPNTDAPSGGMTKEEMLEQAEEIDIQKIYLAASSNKVNAEDTYKGNIYAFAGFVDTIESDYILVYNTEYGNYTTKVYMDRDDIKKISVGQWIEIVGEITAVDSIDKTGEYGIVFTSGVEVSSAYFVTDTFEITGNLSMHFVNRVPQYWEITLDDGTVNSVFVLSLYKEALSLKHEIPLVVGENSIIISGTEVTEFSNITISCKITTPDVLRDITLISVNSGTTSG